MFYICLDFDWFGWSLSTAGFIDSYKWLCSWGHFECTSWFFIWKFICLFPVWQILALVSMGSSPFYLGFLFSTMSLPVREDVVPCSVPSSSFLSCLIATLVFGEFFTDYFYNGFQLLNQRSRFFYKLGNHLGFCGSMSTQFKMSKHFYFKHFSLA